VREGGPKRVALRGIAGAHTLVGEVVAEEVVALTPVLGRPEIGATGEGIGRLGSFRSRPVCSTAPRSEPTGVVAGAYLPCDCERLTEVGGSDISADERSLELSCHVGVFVQGDHGPPPPAST
jgi:hypothetical protein